MIVECPRIPGCAICESEKTCKKCNEGYFLDDANDAKCFGKFCFQISFLMWI